MFFEIRCIIIYSFQRRGFGNLKLFKEDQTDINKLLSQSSMVKKEVIFVLLELDSLPTRYVGLHKMPRRQDNSLTDKAYRTSVGKNLDTIAHNSKDPKTKEYSTRAS